jgi:hypothetical protein
VRRDEATYHGDDGPITVRLAAMGRASFDELIEAHPPVKDRDLWLEDTFAPALIAASVTSWSMPYADENPHQMGRIDVATAAEWWDEWPTDAAEDLFGRCVALNITSIEWARRRLNRDPRLAAEVAYCADHGIPHSAFLSWSERDQDLALAHEVRAGDRCPGCGVPADLMGVAGAFTVVSRGCVQCELKAQVEATIPPEHAHRYHHHLQAVIPEQEA